MSGPYLERGESIVLTADRVSLDQIIYEAMLTTRQLILIDTLNARFEPRIIPLATIQSVRSGTAATGEPVISLAARQHDTEGTTMSVILFLQDPLENRKHDRDLWVKKLIELSLSGRAEHIQDEPEHSDDGLRPSVRRWIAPDVTRPRSENFPVPARDMLITIDEPEPATLPEIASTHEEPVETGEHSGDENKLAWPVISCGETKKSEAGFSATPITEPDGLAIPGPERRNSIENADTIMPAEVTDPKPPAFQALDTTVPDAPVSLTASILAAVRSLTGQRKPTSPLPPTSARISAGDVEELPEISIRRTSLLPENKDKYTVMESDVQPAAGDSSDQPDIPEQLPIFDEVERGVRRSSLIPEIPSPPPEEETCTAAEVETPPVAKINVQPPTSDEISGMAVSEPIEDGVCEDLGGRPEEEPTVPLPIENTSTSCPASLGGIIPYLIAGGIILIILLVVASGIFLPGIQPQVSPPVTVTPTTIPVISLTTTPTKVPTVISETVPQKEGVWVRIVSPAYFYGEAGNPGFLQPVSGNGEKFVSMLRSNGLVQVSVEKLDYTNDELLVEIFRNGTLLTSRSTIAPRGSIELLIDPATGNPPGIAPVNTTTNNSGNSQLEYY